MAYESDQQYSIFDWILNNNLDPEHKLMKLAARIDWDPFIEKLSTYYSTRGRRAKRIRMTVALHILKHLYNMSDEQVVEGLRENVYWMAFCGVPSEEMLTGKPLKWLDSSTMTKFRKRIGAEGMRAIEEVIREQIFSDRRHRPRVMIADTTCMEKHIAYPTDAHLLDKGRRKLVRVIRKMESSGVQITEKVRSYTRVGRKALCEINKFGRKSKETVQRCLIQLAWYAEDVVSKVPHVLQKARKSIKKEKGNQVRRFCQELEQTAEHVQRVLRQTKARLLGVHIPEKIYSLEEPQVACITKGKRSKAHEYGSKVSLAISTKGYVIAHREYPDNRHDNRTLPDALKDWKTATGSLPDVMSLDRNYRYKKGSEPEEVSQIGRIVVPSLGKGKAEEQDTWWFQKYKRKRSTVEAVISHLKQDHRMDRCRYRGFEGDQINASLAVTAWNLKKWSTNIGKTACQRGRA